MVFQSYAIWPHMSVAENVAFPLTVGADKPSRPEARRRALDALDLVGLAGTGDRSATTLSGGQQQRVALARALVREPKVLLLDEPLSNLDAQLRERMRGEIRAVQQKLGITAVYVTHDQNEALAISDLILVMDSGTIVETGAPQQIYRRPRAEFTANFIGVANAFDGTVRSSDGERARADDAARRPGGSRAGAACRRPVRVFVRPENFELTRKRHSDDDWSGVIRYGIYQGDCWDYTVDVAGADVRVRVHKEKVGLGHGDVVHLCPDGTEVVVMALHDGAVSTLKGSFARRFRRFGLALAAASLCAVVPLARAARGALRGRGDRRDRRVVRDDELEGHEPHRRRVHAAPSGDQGRDAAPGQLAASRAHLHRAARRQVQRRRDLGRRLSNLPAHR